MTEQEWLQTTDSASMLEHLRGKVSERKSRLFLAARCRNLWMMTTSEDRAEVDVAEMFADGETDDHPLASALKSLQEPLARVKRRFARGRRPFYIIDALLTPFRGGSDLPQGKDAADRFLSAAYWTGPAKYAKARINARYAAREAERTKQTATIRCLFGNPFRPVTLNSAWLTWHGGLLVSMARQMYDSRDFRDLPVLADALEEAGCQDQDILGHCRSGGEHVRGCWVVDLCLGKS
jgi:hypothetical protein